MVFDNDLSQALIMIIDRYIEAHKHQSLASLAKSAGVGYTTVRRIAQGECVPNQETTLAIIDVTLTTNDKIEFLQKFYPRLGKMLKQAYPSDVQNVPSEWKKFRNSETHCFVFNLAANKRGTDRKQVERITGLKGLKALEELVEAEILQVDQFGCVRFSSDSWAMTNLDDVLLQLSYAPRFFDKELVGTQGSAMNHVTGAVNLETLKKIHQLVREFGIKLINLKDAEESQGDIPFYMDLLMNLYDKKSYQKEVETQDIA